MACALIATSASAAAPPAPEEDLVAFEVEVEVIDYTTDGEVISVHTETFDLDDTTLAPTIQVTSLGEDLTSADWWVAYQSGLVDVSLLSSNIGHYNNGNGSHSAHKNNVQWKVCSGGAGLCGWFYPRVNITVRGDGSAYASASSGV